MPKYIPILFSTPMVQAILEGRKTQTRRVVKPQPEQLSSKLPIPVDQFVKELEAKSKKGLLNISTKGPINGMAIPDCPYGEVGNILWVRETSFFNEDHYVYAANLSNEDIAYFKGCWTPSIYMPKEACRIWLEITDIKIECLKEISEADAKSEGVEPIADGFKNYAKQPKLLTHLRCFDTAKISFLSLWESINGYESSELNPWVWVITFKRVAKPL